MHKSGSTHSVREILEHLAHLLPAQGPIGVFVHHNTLHSFEHLPFEQAVVEASRLYHAEPYMSEDAYRRELHRGRIRKEDIDSVLAAEPNGPVLSAGLDRFTLRRTILLAEHSASEVSTLLWRLEESPAKLRHQAALFDVCLRSTPNSPHPADALPARPRDGVLAATGLDLDEFVNPLLVRLAAAFLDQGLAYWPMPLREQGFYAASRELLAQPGAFYGDHLGGLRAECLRHRAAAFTAEDSIQDFLSFLHLQPAEHESLLRAELLAMPGWAGLFARMEANPHSAPHVHVPASLVDYLAVRLLLTRVALISATSGDAKLWRTPQATESDTRLAAAVRLFDAATAIGMDAATLSALSDHDFARLREEVEAFSALERRRLLHLAYERRHERMVLLPLQAHRRLLRTTKPARPKAQVFFCIDEREESIRRHLEELEPRVETFGAAGFFGVAIDYEGIDDAHSVPLCPVVVQPQHAVRETVADRSRSAAERRAAIRKLWSKLARGGFLASRSLLRGWLATGLLGVLSIAPLIAHILNPRQYAKLREKLNAILVPRPDTELSFTRESDETLDGLQRGFSVAEKADRVAGVLGGAGLLNNFARLVVVLGHGSTSLNNPHESAHDCGACGGRRGGPNARLFAAMANHPGVRAELRHRGIAIPDDCWFIGGYHDTCSDDIDLYDLSLLPESHREEFCELEELLDRARSWNAHERSRRFEFANPDADEAAALHHVEERSEHLAEPRPEYGHCTNAVCIVGRRATTRGLFLDRRAFLVSYDASQDPTDKYLAGQLGAVIPVCAGINLEYYFSFVDNERYGCGTKLPHNVTGLMGVMNGSASDLRTGLPWQMVEIHEPVRILFVVETTPARLLATISANPTVLRFVQNEWIRISTLNPDSGEIHVYRKGQFLPLDGDMQDLPLAASSVEWYRGRMEHLPLARIAPQEARH